MLKQAVKLMGFNTQPCLKKHIHVSAVNRMIKPDNVTEIRIPVPWGHVAGKWWGNTERQPLLALHGVQDNAVTFDTLIPLLEADSILALDMPGHGLSSNLPIGYVYHVLDAVTLIRYVIKDVYNWKKPVLLGHSFGSNLFFFYCAAFSDEVDKFISIDCSRHQMAYRPDNILEKLRTVVDKALDVELKPRKPPEYTEKELLDMFYKSRLESIPKDVCKQLLSRGTTKLENGKCFLSRDIRVKLPCHGQVSFSDLVDMSTCIKCDVLSIVASKGVVRKNMKGDVFMKTVENMNKNSTKRKWWGNIEKQPILALHGVQDNAATFDTLIPLLQADSILAMDIPGHGLSSNLPIGYDYHLLDAVTLIRYVIKDVYNWKKPVLLGHSFGSNLFFFYCAAFSDEVDKFISIDCSRHQMAYRPDNIVEKLRTVVDKALDVELKPRKPPEYTEKELLDMFYKSRLESIPKDVCKLLLSRGTTKLENGKCFLSRDIRVKLPCHGRVSFSDLVDMSTCIKCDVLSIAASKGVVKKDRKGEVYMKTIENMTKNSAKSKFLVIDGLHHIHFEQTQRVADAINEFLKL